jgi:HEAT repeat protein
MKNFLHSKRSLIFAGPNRANHALPGSLRVGALALSLAAFGLVGSVSAQSSYLPSKVSSISAEPYSTGTMVSIATDSPLGSAQNWQDGEGYHLILPNTAPPESLRGARGIRVRRIGTSVEVLLQTKPGARVSLQSAGNQISVFVDRKLEARPVEGDAVTAAEQPTLSVPQSYPQLPTQSAPLDSTSNSSAATTLETSPAPASSNPVIPASKTQTELVPQGTAPARTDTEPSEIKVQTDDEGFMASIFSGTSVFIVMALGLFGLLVSRKMRSREVVEGGEKSDAATKDELNEETDLVQSLDVRGPQKGSAGPGSARSSDTAVASTARQPVGRVAVSGPTSLFGAYRIDQEVGKLILGQPHRMDVLGSRASDDRRAIENSLIKGVNAPDLDDSGRRRAREALEEYGFVARQCASLLLAPDAFERTSAARALGEIKSPAALPFLLEGLYDSESIVRNQAVMSIGELKLPSAIGALLDIARTHPDVPSSLLSRTLSACSVEGLDFFDTVLSEPLQLGAGRSSVVDNITHLEPSTSVTELPETCADPEHAQALAHLASLDLEERSQAIKVLGQYRVQDAVKALIQLAGEDAEPSVRSLAISTLGAIDHESVFPAILIGMADDTREVRAAAARALSRLNFDRTDAYVRVIETCDEETIRKVASACIQAGIVSQNLDRLATSDHRQAYETFSLICLLAKANLNEPVLNAIAGHPSVEVRLNAVHLLASTGQRDTLDQLRALAASDGVNEEVKTAVLEALYRLGEHESQAFETVAEMAVVEQFSDLPGTSVVADADDVEFGFAFGPTATPEPQSPFDLLVESDLDEVEM